MSDFKWDDVPKADSSFDWNEHPVDESLQLEQAPKVSPLESGARGAAQGLTFGFADEATGGAEALLNALKGSPEKLSDLYRKHRDESRANYKAAEEENPKSYMAGQVGGAVAPAILSGGAGLIGSGARALGGAAAGVGDLALQGAALGLGNSEADLTKGDVKDAVIDAGKGAAFGGGLGAVGKIAGEGLGAASEWLAPKISGKLDDVAERQAARAMGLERGTAKKLGEGQIKKIGRQALDNDVLSLGASTDDLIAKNNALKELAMGERSSAYNAIDEAGASTFNPNDVAATVGESLGDFNKTSPLNSGKLRQLDSTLEAIQQRGSDNISMAEAQDLLNELRDAAKWSGVGNKSPQEEMAQAAYMKVRQAVNKAAGDASDLVQVPGLRNTIESANSKYSIAKDTDKLLANKKAREVGNKTFGLTDWITGSAGLAAAPITGGMSAIGGAAAVGAKKLSEKYGSQAIALGANKLSEVVQKSPEIFGKYGSVLKNAAQRGGNSLGITDFLLQQNDPQYRELKKKMDGE